jgi:hypothetical protein
MEERLLEEQFEAGFCDSDVGRAWLRLAEWVLLDRDQLCYTMHMGLRRGFNEREVADLFAPSSFYISADHRK